MSRKKKIWTENNNNLTTFNNWIYKKQKRNLGKQSEQEQNHRNRDHMEGYQLGKRWERMGEKIPCTTGNKQHNW